MGSRGAFVNVSTGDFSFVEGGQRYYSVGTLSTDSNIKVLIQKSGAVKAPEYSHTADRVYAVVQNGMLKHVSFYDENHNQTKSIDLLHTHGKDRVKPHIHYNYPVTDVLSPAVFR
jgi:hypothetical protein